MKNISKCLYFISSNASKEYILDILETLSLPMGAVQHFRYQLRWLDEELKCKLHNGEAHRDNELKNLKVVICYLYLEKDKDKYKWIGSYPIRTGILIDSYKTGDTDEDIVHFYFKVENYISYESASSIKTITDRILQYKDCINASDSYIEGEGILGKTLVFWNSVLPNECVASKEESKAAFHKICESINLEHFKSPEGKKYYPLFYYTGGLKDKRAKFIEPKYDFLSHKSYYELEEGSRYVYEFATYSPQPPPEYLIKLLSDENIFSTPSEYELKISSRYDEESWDIISSLLERDTWSSISFKTELTSNINHEEPLNISVNFPIKVRRRLYYRIIDAGSDIGFGIGTGAIALSKVVENWTWWYWPVIFGYGAWATCKLIIKIWRG